MPGFKNPGIFILGVNMELKRIISYIDGRVVYYYDKQEVTYRKDREPEIKIKVYDRKGIYGLLDHISTVRTGISSARRY